MENLLLDWKELNLEGSFKADGWIILRAVPTASEAACREGQQPSSRVHRRSQRTLADLPGCGQRVKLLVQVRRFFCLHQACRRRLFTEPLPAGMARYARRTLRQQQAVETMGLALGGRAGPRAASRLGF